MCQTGARLSLVARSEKVKEIIPILEGRNRKDFVLMCLR